MNRNLENVCRVCLSSGSRNIFEKASTIDDIAVPSMDENVSSLDRLPEKLRYVTMLKVNFFDIFYLKCFVFLLLLFWKHSFFWDRN